MRTHLLRTVYASPALEALAAETGSAANDETYAPDPATTPARTGVQPITVTSATFADNDDYVLGGYAGI
jgi:hypothetical protein